MKKGFTIIEILIVTGIMAIILLVALPTYNTITQKIKENVYTSKVKELLAKGENYAEETGLLVFNVNTLIESGKLTPDNETGIYKDPRSNRKMNCDIIEIHWQENQYQGTIIESDECLTEEELNNRYGMVTLKIIDETGIEIPKIVGTEWLNKNQVYITYEWKEAYKDLESKIENITWSGEERKSCEKENKHDCKNYAISTDSTKMVTVSFQLTINHDGVTTTSNYSQNVYLDTLAPEIKNGSIILSNEYSSNQERKVNFEITDYNGSGIKEYGLVKNKTCNGSEYNANRKNATEGVQTEYLPNGTYYICVMDKVGNKTNDNVLEQTKIVVDNVDNSIPSVSLSIKSKDARYQTKDVSLTITASDDGGVSNLKMCISNTGYLQNCSWEAYTNTKAWSLTGNYDGGVRTVYVTVQDAAGNIAQNKANYTIYKSCSKTSKAYESETYSACTKTCGGGTQTRNYQMKDSYLGNVCSNGQETRNCNTQDCCSSLNYSSWSNWSSCTAVCGGGTQTRIRTATSTYNGQSCAISDADAIQTQSCNPHSCGPVMTRIGENIRNVVFSPLSENKIVAFRGYETYYDNGNPKNKYALDAQVINVSKTSASYGPIQTIMDSNAPGSQIETVRIDANTIVLAGNSNTSGGGVRAATIKIDNNNITIPYISSVISEVGSTREGLSVLSYSPNSPDVTVIYNDSAVKFNNFHSRTYTINSGKTSKESIISNQLSGYWNYYGDKDGFVSATRSYTSGGLVSSDPKIYDYIGLNNGHPIAACKEGIYEFSGFINSPCRNLNGATLVALSSSYSDYATFAQIGHMGNDKIVVRTMSRTSERIVENKISTTYYTYHAYLLFYQKQNDSWSLKSVLEAPENNKTYSQKVNIENSSLISLSDTAIIYNSNEGLYYISYP